MAFRGRYWKVSEIALMQSLILEGRSLAEVRLSFPDRGYYSMRAKYAALQRKARLEPEQEETRSNADDLAFQDAMLAAIRRGRESAPIGISKTADNNDFRPRFIQREPTHFGNCALSDL